MKIAGRPMRHATSAATTAILASRTARDRDGVRGARDSASRRGSPRLPATSTRSDRLGHRERAANRYRPRTASTARTAWRPSRPRNAARARTIRTDVSRGARPDAPDQTDGDGEEGIRATSGAYGASSAWSTVRTVPSLKSMRRWDRHLVATGATDVVMTPRPGGHGASRIRRAGSRGRRSGPGAHASGSS